MTLEQLTELQSALARFHDVLQEPLDAKDYVLDAAIQRFEFTYELCWKAMKRALKAQGIEAPTPRRVFEEAYAAGWIDNEALWLQMLGRVHKIPSAA
jgi:nucleotidyltransferase substrate binding protein (TIGR01987 family)